MELEKAIHLISKAHLSFEKEQNWLDLGCGSGLFTKALAFILPTKSRIVGVDKAPQNFSKLSTSTVVVDFHQANFETEHLPFSNLDGILMANALHFVQDKTSLLSRLQQQLKNTAGFLLIEYDTDIPNPWVPYPLSSTEVFKLFGSLGYRGEKIGQAPSRYQQAPLTAYALYP